jgi:deoxyadenosine/deoxycytidine kinase
MLISIEGNIGSGKSTFCNYLKDHFSKYYNRPHGVNILFVDEPVEDWVSIKDSSGDNILERFYKNPEKYAFCFQMTAYISRLANLKTAIKKCKDGDIIITERSVFSDYNVFAKMLYDTGKINQIEYQCYRMWFKNFLEDLPYTFYVYIKTDFNNCYNRVLNRGRKGETPITKEYLESCGMYHDEWLSKERHILTFDGNKDTNSHHEYVDVLKQMINYNTNFPTKFIGRMYYESKYEKEKWNKRLYNRTLDQCKKRLKKD